jgi:hypothetical protein
MRVESSDPRRPKAGFPTEIGCDAENCEAQIFFSGKEHRGLSGIAQKAPPPSSCLRNMIVTVRNSGRSQLK